MAIVFTGSKTVTQAVSPTETAAVLTTLLATAPENMTVGQVRQLANVLKHVAGGNEETNIVGTLLV
jgi:hypothetical protein